MSTTAHDVRADSVHVFLEGLFDYAGLFPPAGLPLETALREYDAYSMAEDAWMLGPFVCPVARLPELSKYESILRRHKPFRISALAARVQNAGELIASLRDDFNALDRFMDHFGAHVSAEALEVYLPSDTAKSDGEARHTLERLEEVIEDRPPSMRDLFLEIERGHGFQDRVARLASAVAGRSRAEFRIGLKIRCGGMNDNDFPKSEEVAAFLSVVVDAGVAFKATAGLHHPVRMLDEARQVTMHGFLNVFFAATLLAEDVIDGMEAVGVLNEESPAAFQFEPGRIRWRDRSARVDALARVRHGLAISIGSCSFDEPRDDLTKLGWLTSRSSVSVPPIDNGG